MAKNNNIIEKFELILKGYSPNQHSVLYSGIKNKIPGNSDSKHSLTVDQVICNVSRQIHAIQSADCRKSSRAATVNINKYKKPTFVPVHMLEGAEIMPQNTNSNRFESQCVTDSQLINIVQDAEELVSHKGMVQAFDMTFCTQDLNMSPVRIVTDSNDLYNITDVKSTEHNLENDKEPVFPIIDISLKEPDQSDDVDSLFDEESEINVEQEQIDTLESTIIADKKKRQNVSDINLPSSPVFNIKTTKKSPTPPPLVVELEAFEQFEKIALPIVEKNTDQEIAKCLVSSQILGKELCFQLENKPVLYEDGHQVSPVINWSENKFQFDQIDEYFPTKGKSVSESKSTQSSILKDEILFSSDEENECGLQEYCVEDLPFTCALATSFYELPDVLDKTMYVGFQTASNKSIQISTESFYKAKSILADFKADVSEIPSLRELVEICDGQNSTAVKDCIKIDGDFSATNNIKTVCRDTIDFLDCKDDKTTLEHEPVNRLLALRDLSEKSVNTSQAFGFKTASNKKICLSEKALQLSKRFFKDIDLNENDNCKVMTVKESTDKQSERKITENRSAVLPRKTVKNNKELNLDESVLLEFENNVMAHENVDQYEIPDLVGFKTASKKNTRVSDAALEKSKIILKDIKSPNNVNDIRATNTNFIEGAKQSNVGFKTASNKEIKISNQAMEKSKSLFSDLEILDDKYNNFEYTKQQISNSDLGADIGDRPSTSKTPFVGFKTASNKEIKISDIAIFKTNKIFEDISSNDVLNENNARFVKPKYGYPSKICNKRSFDDVYDKAEITLKTDYFIESQTVTSKIIKLSEESLMKTRNIFEELEKDATYKDNADKSVKCIKAPTNKTQFKGFQTASEKPVIISNDALEKSKIICKKLDSVIDETENSSKSTTSFKGFHTASNIPINITQQALLKSKKIFENIEKDTDVKEIEVDNFFKGYRTASDKFITVSEDAFAKSKKLFENIDDVKKQTPFKGFQTASNKKFEVSEDILARSKKMYENINVDTKPNNIEKSIQFEGFKTASNKNVNVSALALARSRKIFENIDDVTEPVERVKKGAFQSFQIAKNKKVDISETALARSKKILESISIEVDVDEADIQNNACQEFLTGHHKKVNISDQDVATDRKILENIDSAKSLFENQKEPPFRGFQTASNKEVQICKEALAKTKGIFQNIDIISVATDNSTNLPISQVIPVKSTYNTNRNVSKESFRESDRNSDYVCKILNKQIKSDTKETFAKSNLVNNAKDTFIIENVIDTQLLNDFDKSLHTEDFSRVIITPAKSKRSGSPILSCPKAKRRKKFETPYNKTQKNIVTTPIVEQINKHDDTKLLRHIFDKNYKKTKQYNLSDIHNMEKDNNSGTQNRVDPDISEHNFESLLRFEFCGPRNELSKERWTSEDIKKYFLNSVNKNLVPDGWIDNHLKLIVWKLISYEIKFPKTLGVVCTSKNVIEQLKYRYDKELFNSERPALRKIIERDDVSTKLMVLCVAAVYEDRADMDKVANQKTVELLLTDGWYCIRACLDRMLSKLVLDGRIAVGSKIVTSGAELVGCEQGIAPWEDTSQVRLKLCGNSTRRARWLTRLGYHGNGAILSRLRDVRPDGGRVARLRVFVARVYPTLYIEKFDDGSTVTRSERLELLHQMKYENERQGLLEKLYEEVQKEFSDEVSQDSEVDPELKAGRLDSGSQIARAMKSSRDPAEFKSKLTETQVELLNDHTTRKRDRLIQDVQARVKERMAECGLNVRRNVVPLMKIRIADVREGENVEVSRGLMSIWKPNDAITDIVKEGAWIEVMNVMPTAIRYSEIQISAGRQSIFSQSKHKESEKNKLYLKSMERICYPIKDLSKKPSMTTEYNEVDTVGLVFLIEPSIEEFDSNKNQFQNVYLADADKNMICVNFWGGLNKLGFENILDTGQVVTCINLQKRAGNTRKNIPQYRVTEFSYFTRTPKNDIARNIREDLDRKLHGVEMKFCDDCVVLKNNYSVFKMQNYNENVSPYRCQKIDLNLSKNKMFIDSPLIARGVKNDENFNLSGLDFESTFKQVDTQEYSPKTMIRKRQIKEKIDKLKMYGEPPALSPIQILNKSRNAASAFKSPLPKSDVSKSVVDASEILLKQKIVESVDKSHSPVIMNRTFVKRTNVNPVKLDFNSVAIDDSNVSDLVDHFAEEFDGSPPLSLD